MKQRTKNIFLVTGFVIMLLIAYQYAITNTLEVKTQLEQIQSQIANNAHFSKNRSNIESQEAYLDSIIGQNRNNQSSSQNNLLSVLNRFSEDLSYRIISFKEPHIQILEDSSQITSYNFVLEGNYKNLEQLLYTLENEYSFGSFSHISFQRKKDYRLNREFLHCEVLIRNME